MWGEKSETDKQKGWGSENTLIGLPYLKKVIQAFLKNARGTYVKNKDDM